MKKPNVLLLPFLITLFISSATLYGEISIKKCKNDPENVSVKSIKELPLHVKQFKVDFVIKNDTKSIQIYNKYCTTHLMIKTKGGINPLKGAGSNGYMLIKPNDIIVLNPKCEAKIQIIFAFYLNNKNQILLLRSNESGFSYASDPIPSLNKIELVTKYKNDITSQEIEKLRPSLRSTQYKIIRKLTFPAIKIHLVH